MVEEYSDKLCKYIGRVELKAFVAKDRFGRYIAFHDAVMGILAEDLSPKESRLAREFLFRRMSDTNPGTIDCASREHGYAD